MKLVFVHDHKFLKYEDQYYSTGGLSGEALKRYVDAAGNVTIVARCIEINETSKHLSHSSIEGTRFVPVPNHKSVKSYYKISLVKTILKKEILESDLVIARISSLGNMAIRFAKKYNKPYLVEVVGCPWDSLWNYNWRGKVVAPFSYLNLRKLIKEAPYVLYVTNNFLQSRYPTNGYSVNCSNVSLTDFDEKIINKRLEKINNMNSSKKLIIGTTAAVDVKYKGQQSVIKALSKLKKQGITNYEYQIVGGGNQSYLKSVARKYEVLEQVKFLGTIPHKEIFSWLDTIDIYAQPSKTEGLPRALIEAMSRGILAIGTNAGGIPELLDEKYIFSKSTNNDEEICKILREVKKSDLYSQAKQNYETSKEYDKKLIESRRQSFFKNFIEHNS
ncbi:glycosyltransferase [Alteribacter keqinensis]|uniref:Glycosyltransferase n=1 Tax=Alteribacter keqinensis TaxID=2483800 RepID=A0A3M7TQ17_9BACI|nr:glycosyltransferase [Alteribacter keqinensis]RNA67736.1 glycosyltransferase [Alteribacter keqinensis]